MPTELTERRFRVDELTGEIPDDADVKITDSRLQRASELEPGNEIVDCSFKVVTAKEITWEIASFITLVAEEESDEFDKIYDLPEAEQKEKFQELFGDKPVTYELIDVGILDTNGGCHSFFYCCHFLDEHENCYPGISLVRLTP